MDDYMSSILLVNLNLLCFYAIRYLSYSTQKIRDDNERMDNFMRIFGRYLETMYPQFTVNTTPPENTTSETFVNLIKKYQIPDDELVEAQTQTESRHNTDSEREETEDENEETETNN